MKKLLAIMALVGVLAACNNKKKDEKKPEKDTVATTTTTTPTDNTTTTTTTTTTTAGVPTFSDPEVQKFANDYAAFIQEYKAGMKDPAKLSELAKTMQDWSSRATNIGMKLAQKPDEAKAWADWMTACSKELMPQ